jgi:hypothetical protein
MLTVFKPSSHRGFLAGAASFSALAGAVNILGQGAQGPERICHSTIGLRSGNTIGALMLHLAAAAILYQRATFNNESSGKIPAD